MIVLSERRLKYLRGGPTVKPEQFLWLMWSVELNKEIGHYWVKSVSPEAPVRPVSGFKTNKSPGWGGGMATDRGKVLQNTSPLLIAMEQKNMSYFREVGQQCVSVTLNSTFLILRSHFQSPLKTLSSLEGQKWCVHRSPKYSLEVRKV